MYGLSKNFDLSFFVGKELMELCFSIGQIILFFSDEISISIEGSMITFDNIDYSDQEHRSDGHVLHVLLGKKIIAANHGSKNGDLILDFEDNHQLILHDDSEHYESYHFWGPRGLTVI